MIDTKKLRSVFLPGIILQSVLIGGGYATGREIIEYGARFGANGWVSGLTIFIGFSLLSVLSIEACRYWQVFDYKSLLKKIAGNGWLAYEVAYLLLAVLTIAVMASAAGEILNRTMGFNVWIGIVLIILLVGILNYKGEEFIAKMETLGTIGLFAAYFIFTVAVFLRDGDAILKAFKSWDTSYLPEESASFSILWTGILYVGYNMGVYPAAFFTVRAIKTRRESILAGLVAGLLMTIPWFLTYFVVMAYYPDKAVLESPVPWLQILKFFHPAMVITFGIVVGWTLVETATGMIHAFISRLETEMFTARERTLKKPTKALISTLALIASVLLAQVGIIDLVAKGYRFMAYVMIAVYGIPLLIAAPKLLFNKKPSGDKPEGF